MWEGKQIVAKCYGQNQLSLYENRCRIWKNKTIDHSVQKVWIPPSIHNTSPMYIYIYIHTYIYILTAIWLPTANFGPLSRGQPHSHNVNNCIFFLNIRPEGHREPRSEVGSLSPAKRLLGFEPVTFWFWLQCYNSLGHSPLYGRPPIFLFILTPPAFGKAFSTISLQWNTGQTQKQTHVAKLKKWKSQNKHSK